MDAVNKALGKGFTVTVIGLDAKEGHPLIVPITEYVPDVVAV